MKVVLATQTYAPVIGGEDLCARLAQAACVGEFTADAVVSRIERIHEQVSTETRCARRRRA